MRSEMVANETVIIGLDDIIDATEIAFLTKYIGGAETDDEVRELAVQAVRLLLERGLMEIGDVVSIPDPRARYGEILDVASWGLSPAEAAERADREWRALGRWPNLGISSGS